MGTVKPRIVRYRWISYYDDVLDKRVSDWDNAESCERCGATIVHVVTVATDDGWHDVGRECAHVLLGWPRPNKSALAREIAYVIAQEEARERNRAFWVAITEEDAVPNRHPGRGRLPRPQSQLPRRVVHRPGRCLEQGRPLLRATGGMQRAYRGRQGRGVGGGAP